jgi:YVTN family beta-propeller protein
MSFFIFFLPVYWSKIISVVVVRILSIFAVVIHTPGYNNTKMYNDIRVGIHPTVISINNSPDKNIIYVVNSGSNTVSIIDGSIDKLTAGVTFNVHPANSGSIWCNNKEYLTNIYLYIASGAKCIAKPNKDFG